MQVVEFISKTYIVEPGAGVPDGAIDPASLSLSEQVKLHNLLVENIGDGNRVRKFRDKSAGTKRVIERLRQYGELLDEDEGEIVKPEPAPKPRAKAKAKPVAERKRRGMRFVFPFHGPDNMRTLRNSETLRGRCVSLLKGGATFAEVEQLVRDFDQERGKKSEFVERRAYELVRIMHYYLGWGIEHNQETGVIKLHQREVGSK